MISVLAIIGRWVEGGYVRIDKRSQEHFHKHLLDQPSFSSYVTPSWFKIEMEVNVGTLEK